MEQSKQEIIKEKSYSFLTDTISFKAVDTLEGKKHYVTGYISVPEIDLYNDLVTPTALKSMLKQITESTIMLDYEHETWRDDSTILPAGKIVDAKIDDKGLWVKAQLNKASPKFSNLWESIKDGFIKAFSIAFKPIKTVMKTIGDTQVRLIEDLTLLNVALTGNPVNQSAVMTDFGMKAVMLKAIEDFGDTEMRQECINNKLAKEETMETKDEQIEKPSEAPVEEKPAEATEEVKEESKEETKEEVKEEVAEAPAEAKVDEKAIEKLTAELKAMADKMEVQEKELKSLKETDVFKSVTPEQPEVKSEKPISILGMIR